MCDDWGEVYRGHLQLRCVKSVGVRLVIRRDCAACCAAPSLLTRVAMPSAWWQTDLLTHVLPTLCCVGIGRRETDRVMTYLENVSKSTSEKGALKSKVLVTLTSDNVFEARPAAKGRGSIITVARPLDVSYLGSLGFFR